MIDELQKGDKTRTARHAAVMNEIITELNKLLEMSFAPEGIAQLVESEGSIKIMFNISDAVVTSGGGTMTFRVSIDGVATDVDITTAVLEE